jgi:hypothetical protein
VSEPISQSKLIGTVDTGSTCRSSYWRRSTGTLGSMSAARMSSASSWESSFRLKAEVYAELGVSVAYDHERRVVTVEIRPKGACANGRVGEVYSTIRVLRMLGRAV